MDVFLRLGRTRPVLPASRAKDLLRRAEGQLDFGPTTSPGLAGCSALWDDRHCGGPRKPCGGSAAVRVYGTGRHVGLAAVRTSRDRRGGGRDRGGGGQWVYHP